MQVMRAPYHANWNITYACPFNCVHCYSRIRADAGDLTLKDKLRVADNIVRSGVFNVNLGGGEPLVSEGIFQVIERLSSAHVHVVMSSNGWRTPLRSVMRLKEAGLGAVLISMDNADPNLHDAFRQQPGSFDACMDAALLYTAQGIPVTFSTVVTSQNLDCLEELTALAHRLGCAGIELKRLRLQGNAQDHQELTLARAQEHTLYRLVPLLRERYPLRVTLVYRAEPIPGMDEGCPCGRTTLCILGNGDLAPCVYNPRIIGNALVDGIDTVWQTSPYLARLRMNFTCHGLEVPNG
jgi:MoaA/NifB/PqqE/SkfB family radical SAM enzyme